MSNLNRQVASPEGIKGYAFLGGLAGVLTPVCHSMIWGLICAFILGWLFKACCWLHRRGTALHCDTSAIASGRAPSALVAWNNQRLARREGLDKNKIIRWFSTLTVVMLLFATLPTRTSARVFAWVFLGQVVYVFGALIWHQFLFQAFAKALTERSRPTATAK